MVTKFEGMYLSDLPKQRGAGALPRPCRGVEQGGSGQKKAGKGQKKKALTFSGESLNSYQG